MMGAETRAQVRALAALYRRGRVDAAGLKKSGGRRDDHGK